MRTTSSSGHGFPQAWVVGLMCVALAGCAATGASRDDAFYATGGDKLLSIHVSDADQVTISEIGPLAPGCGSLTRSATGALYSMCGEGMGKPGPQQLATIDPATGKADVFGSLVEGLMVMGMEFAPDGTLYAVGDANPASPTFNSLYTVDAKTGAFTRVGSTGVAPPDFFHDFTLDANGTMYGSTSQALYTIDLETATATKVIDFVGGGGFGVMGLSYNTARDRLYATEFKPRNSAFYVVDRQNGFLTPLAATGHPFAHALVPASR
jgi:DNA-binding beta-propeller fold protein YncE